MTSDRQKETLDAIRMSETSCPDNTAAMEKLRATYVTKDSGKRQEFETGSRRDTREGKGRYDLISPLVMQRLAGVMERGAAKYGDRNWEKGQPLSRYFDSAFRHLYAALAGADDEDHLGQALWNIHALMHTEEMIREGALPETLADLPGRGGLKT